MHVKPKPKNLSLSITWCLSLYLDAFCGRGAFSPILPPQQVFHLLSSNCDNLLITVLKKLLEFDSNLQSPMGKSIECTKTQASWATFVSFVCFGGAKFARFYVMKISSIKEKWHKLLVGFHCIQKFHYSVQSV